MSVYGYILQKNRVGRSNFHFILFFHFISHTEILDCGPIRIRKRYRTLEYIWLLYGEGVNTSKKLLRSYNKKIDAYHFSGCNRKQFFLVSTFTFDLPIKWIRVAAENRVGRVTVNRRIFFFWPNLNIQIQAPLEYSLKKNPKFYKYYNLLFIR